MTSQRTHAKAADSTPERGQLVPTIVDNPIGSAHAGVARQPYRWLLQDSIVQPKSPTTKKKFGWTQLVERTLVRSPRESGT